MRKWQWLIVAVLAGARLIAQEVVERGPHHNVFRSIEKRVEDGKTVTYTNSFTEIGSGINFLDEAQNSWVQSTDEIEIVETGAVYRKAQFKLRFASNINDPNGNLEWFPAPDQRIVFQTIGIALVEEASGDSVWLGQTKDTQGLLTARNEVTYPGCFDSVDADVRISVGPGGFQNDVILREDLVDPAQFGFQGNCRIEVWHNVLSGPAPDLELTNFQRSQDRVETDTQLKFGNMYIGSGTAFLIGADKEALKGEAGNSVRVSKEYFIDPESQQRFLIESVPLAEAKPHLQTLPASRHARVLDAGDRDRMHASRRSDGKRRRPLALSDRPAAEAKRIVAFARQPGVQRKGLLLDFSSLVTAANQTLRGDTTYVVATNTTVNLTGTTVLEPGCVIKFAGYNSANNTPIINILGALDCQTRPYAPAVLTSREDRTVGDTNTAQLASILTNAYGAYHLCFPASNSNPIKLHDIRSRYALNAFGFLGTGAVEAWNLQAYGTQGDVFKAGGNTVTLRNVLVHNANNVATATNNNTVFIGEHFTIHNASKTFSAASFTGCSFNLLNSLLVVITNSSSSGFTNTSGTILANDTDVFQTVGAGAHYLVQTSPYRDAGSSSLSTNLSIDVFRYSSTYPPQILTNTVAISTILGPQSPRDWGAPDLGYHYPVIDWLIGGVSITNNVTLTLTNGVAVALFQSASLFPGLNSQLNSEGRAMALNRITRYNTVQEQPVQLGGQASMMISANDGSTFKLRFTEVSVLAGSLGRALIQYASPAQVLIRDSELYNLSVTANGYQITSGSYTIEASNSLFSRCDLSFYQGYTEFGQAIHLKLQNDLFLKSSIYFDYQDTATYFYVNDNVFDTTTLTESIVATLQNYNNGYIDSGGGLSGSWGADVFPTAPADYQSGVLGPRYYPTSGTKLHPLRDAGSQSTANAGLYHFTIRTDHTKDTGNVAIGYHYPAIDTSGATDADGDGIPDYLEDTNGNGTADSGETNWQQSNGVGTGAADIVVFTPLQ